MNATPSSRPWPPGTRLITSYGCGARPAVATRDYSCGRQFRAGHETPLEEVKVDAAEAAAEGAWADRADGGAVSASLPVICFPPTRSVHLLHTEQIWARYRQNSTL